MTPRKMMLALALAAGTLAAGPALAWHHGFHGPRVVVGVGIGVPFAYSYPYYPPYYPYYAYPPYYVSPVVVQQQPTVYVEQPQAPQAQPQQPSGYWYYCGGSQAYYPYVKECPGGWQRVAPQPAS